MTVSSTTTKNSYAGDGSTVAFSYTFKIFDEDDIAVILRDNATAAETVQAITTNYTVSGVGNAGGGTITFVTAPATGKTVVLRRESAQTQTTDYTPNDPFPAEAHEDALDKLTFFVQEIQEELDRSIKLSRTNTMTSTEFTVGAADRADKILAFDSNGEISVTQELGTFKGNWGTGTTYAVRDLVKDTSTNNIFIANTAHTSSGSQPLTTNTDSAKWDLLVDAASATTAASSATSSATAAAASASAASISASNASISKTNAANSASNAATSATNAGNSATAASNAQAAAEAALDTFTDQYLGSLASDPTTDLDGNALTDGDLYFNTTDNVMKVYDLGNTTWKQLTPTAAQQTNIDTVSGIAANVTTVAGISGDVTTVSGNTANIGTVAGSISNVNLVGADIANVNTVATNIADVNNFADTYFISATAPSSPTLGDLWFDTTNNVMKVYGSGGFVNAGSSVNGTSNRYNYVVGTASGTYTGSTTVFPATYDAGYVDVYLNGAKLTVTSDFTATNGTDVTLATAATTSDVVDIVAYGTFTAATALSLGDNEKIQLGASQDLQIYHDGSNSYIHDNGTGDLFIRGSSNVYIQNSGGGSSGAQFVAGGAANINYAGVTKLATTATGVDVTGTVTADGLTVDTDTLHVDSTNNRVGIGDITPDDTLTVYGGTQRLRVGNSDSNHVRIGRNSTSGNFEMSRTTSGATDQVFFKAIEANNGNIILQEGGGNVGIGVVPSAWRSSTDAIQIGQSASISSNNNANAVSLTSNSYINSSNNNIYISTGKATNYYQYDGAHVWEYAGSGSAGATVSYSEAMRISGGNLLVGTTSVNAAGVISVDFDGQSKQGITLDDTYASTGGYYIYFRNSANAQAGAIIHNGSTTVNYSTSSDYRLKTAVNYEWDATTRLKQLRPARFKWIADGDDAVPVDGFLAHEVEDIVPESITGTKDAMMDEEYEVSAATGDIYTPAIDAVLDEDGNEVTPAVAEVIHNTDVERPEELAEGQQWRETTPAVMGTRSVPDYQGIDQSKLVPLLVKTIQELEARITALENV